MAAYNNMAPVHITLKCHHHPLQQRNPVNQDGMYTCKSCEKTGTGLRYSCRVCKDYNIHIDCATRLSLLRQQPLVSSVQPAAKPSTSSKIGMDIATMTAVSVGTSVIGHQVNSAMDAHRHTAAGLTNISQPPTSAPNKVDSTNSAHRDGWIDPDGRVGSSGLVDSGSKVDPTSTVDPSGWVDPAGGVDHAGRVDPGGWIDPSGWVDPASRVDSSGWVDSAGSVDPSGWVDRAGSVDPSGWVVPAGSADPSGWVDPTGSVDPSGWVDPTDWAGHASRVDSSGWIDSTGSVDSSSWVNSGLIDNHGYVESATSGGHFVGSISDSFINLFN